MRAHRVHVRRQNHLKRHHPRRHALPRPIDNSHPAARYYFENFEVAEMRAAFLQAALKRDIDETCGARRQSASRQEPQLAHTREATDACMPNVTQDARW